MNRIAFCLILITLISFQLNAQNANQKKIDSFIQKSLHQFKEIPGLAIAVVKDGKPHFTKTYGYSDINNKIKSSKETPYYIASVTKSFVGLLASKLEAEGIFNLDAPITNFKPIKNFKNQSVFKNVTIRDLLSHTSGIKNGMLTWKYASIGDYTYHSMIKLLEHKTSILYNNKKFRYDNFGYNVLDIILHEEFGLSWKKLLQEKVFDPLKMSHTSAYVSKAKAQHWNRAMPYASINPERLPKLVTTQKNDETFQAAGGIISSIDDMQKWLLIHMNKGHANGVRVFDEAVISKTLVPIAKNKKNSTIFNNSAYGLGWNIGQFKDKKVLYHFGGFDGYFAHLSFLPNENIGVVVLANENHFGDNVSNLIASFTYDLFLGNIKTIEDYSSETKKVEKKIALIQEGYKKDRENRAHRKWTLMHDFKKYAGVYKNEHTGKIIISVNKGKIKAKLGISESVATPSVNDESIRVEFRNGRGTDILFISDKNGTMAAVYSGNVYLK